MELLRIATAGSVDDGKSTLIGRLLYDSKAVYEDQLDAVERASFRSAGDGALLNLALLTDGLRAEREQGITIDVAYRYFSTPKRKFVIADTPGHVQYTRNMVTGASTADFALVLVDARKGVVEQSRRHAFIASLLGLRHLVVCVNKMDLVAHDRAVFEGIKDDFRAFAARLDIHDVSFVPVSALHGDNVVNRSATMGWYEGPALLPLLEDVHIASDRNLIDVRFPVQYVLRPGPSTGRVETGRVETGVGGLRHLHDYRAYAGTVAAGVMKVGDEVTVLPSGQQTTVVAIDTADGEVAEAYPPMAVAVRLADALDVSRGDLICRPHNQSAVGREIDAMVCWVTDRSDLRPGARYAIKHTSRWARAVVDAVHYRLDINTLHRDEDADSLALNDIGRLRLRTTVPLLYDDYRRNRSTGSFILVDEATHDTVGAGMILPNGSAPRKDERLEVGHG